MTTAEIVDQEGSEEGLKKKLSKTRRRPWRKRVRNIILSPVHLVRRYVFRKSPSKKKRPDSKLVELKIHENQVDAAVRSAKQRKIPCYFLFVGASQSGKSTTISKLFNGERPKSRADPAINVHHNSFAGNDIGIKVVDTPGLLGLNTEEQDELTITAIRSFLKRDLPTRIPTVTFITSRLSPEEDENEQLLQFSQMLKELAAIRKYITDECCSNVVLLLTHSQSVENSSDEGLPSIIAKYQEAFSKIFPSASCPVPVIAIENIRRNRNHQNNNGRRYHDIVFDGLRNFAEQRKQYTLHSLVDWLAGAPRRFSVSFTPVTFPISHFPAAADVEDHPNQDNASDTDCDAKEHLNCEPYFVMNDIKPTKAQKKQKKPKNGKEKNVSHLDQNNEGPITLIPEGSQVMLSNKTVINIENCLVGDKLLGINPSRYSVITGIGRENYNDLISRNTPVGTLHCSVKMSSESDDESKKDADTSGASRKLIYAYQNEQFFAVDVTKAEGVKQPEKNSVYFLDLDAPDGSFILNGYPCFSKMSNIVS